MLTMRNKFGCATIGADRRSATRGVRPLADWTTRSLSRADDGAALVEYILLVVLIAIVVLAAALVLGIAVFDLFDQAADSVP